MTLPADYQERQKAIDPMRSVCVTAPAGSGKTELLSQRVLTLLSRVTQPEEILAITFTRKAAAEMHQRIIAALRMAQVADEPEEAHRRMTWQLAKAALEQDKRCGWQLLKNPSRLKVLTIDGLCGNLTRQMPVLSNFGAQPLIDENPQTSYCQAVNNVLVKLESHSPTADALSILMAHLGNDMDRAQRLMVMLLEKRDQWLLHMFFPEQEEKVKEVLEGTLQRVIQDALTQVRKNLQIYAGELLPLLDYLGGNLKESNSENVASQLAGITDLPGCLAADQKLWVAIVDVLLTSNHQWRKTVNVKNGFPTQTPDGNKALAKERKQQFMTLLEQLKTVPDLLESLTEVRFLPARLYTADQWQLLAALARLLPELVAELMLIFQQRGVVDYAQVSMAAMQSLGDSLSPTDLALKLDYQLHHILIDEFQDTSTSQFELLYRLVEGWKEFNEQNKSSPKTLFLVGDGMQSIYGFREANVGLFLTARDQGVNGVELDRVDLVANFRSLPVIVGWVNRVFSKAFPAADHIARGAVSYETSQAFKSSEPHAFVAVKGFDGESAEASEALFIVGQVVKTQSVAPNDSIAILVRSRSHLKEIIPALRRAGLNWNAADIDPLIQYGPVMDLLSLTRALFNVADKVAWAALLRSPLCGLNNSDLHALLAFSKEQSVLCAIWDESIVANLTQLGRSHLSRFRDVVLLALQQRDRKSLRSWLEGIWLSLGGMVSLATVDDFNRVEDYLALLDSHSQQGFFSLTEFEVSVKKLFAAPKTEDTKLHIMTIHKSKGLEFDTVFLPGLSKGSRSNEKSLLMWREYLSKDSFNGLILSPLSDDVQGDDAIYQYLRFEQSQSEQLENTRLLYVAATRAVKRLCLSFTADYDEEKEAFSSPNKNSLLNTVWPGVETEALRTQSCQTSLAENSTQHSLLELETESSETLWRLPANWKAPESKAVNPLSAYYPSASFDNTNVDFQVNDNTPRLLGTIIHLALEFLADQGVEFWLEKSHEQRRLWVTGLLNLHQVSRSRHGELIMDIETSIHNTVTDQKGRWILSKHKYAESEKGLLVNTQQSVSQFIVDRTFLDEKGVRWIVDFKTGKPLDGESKEMFIERASAAYREQLWQYKRLYQSMGAESVRTALYFTYYPCWKEIDCEGA